MIKRLGICLLLFVGIVYANPLPVDQAFKLTVTHTPKLIQLDWSIAPGYRLYRDSIKVESANNQLRLGHYYLPAGLKRFGPLRGHYQAYENSLTLEIPVSQQRGQQGRLVVSYQGCKIDGYCYAPVQRSISIQWHAARAQVSAAQPLQVKSLVGQHSDIIQLLIFFLLGILLAFTPCVLPMIPILSSIIVGHGKHVTTAKAFFLSLVYVLAMAVTYALAGLVLGLAGASVQASLQKPWAIIIFAAIFVLLALSLFGLYEIRLPGFIERRLQASSRHQKSGSFVGVAIMGILSALIVSPCISAPLVGALTYITDKANVWMGVASLFLLALGMGVPLMVVGVASGKLLPKAGAWMDDIKALFGFMLLAMAIYLLGRIVTDAVVLSLWGVLLVAAGVFFWRRSCLSSQWLRLRQGVLAILIAYGILLIVGGMTGHDELFAPLGRHHQQSGLRFTTVTTASQLNRALQSAKQRQQKVLIEFGASWCVECVNMQRETFSNAKVQQALRAYDLIEADVTRNDDSAIALKKRFAVVGTPTLIFIDNGGQVLPEFTTVGFVSAQQLLSIVQRVQRGNENGFRGQAAESQG